MFLTITNISQGNYNTRAKNPQKLNVLLQKSLSFKGDSFKKSAKVNSPQYNELVVKLPYKRIKDLLELNKKGILSKKDDEGKTVLENLHGILKEKRAEGFDNINVLGDTIKVLNNPYSISQKSDNSIKNSLEVIFSPKTPVFSQEKSSTCTASCIEFDLASKEPAEFTRFVKELTSPNLAVKKSIDLENLAEKTLEAFWLLNTFEVEQNNSNFNKVDLVLRPDENILHKIKLNNNNNKKEYDRTNVDTVLQSTFMNLGSQHSYNSLTDKRGGKFGGINKGLIEFEKTFVESVVRNKNIISVNYQKIENDDIVGYETDFETMKTQLKNSFALGENVIVGLTNKDKNGKIRGHEVVLTGYSTNALTGKTEFYGFNSDKGKNTSVIYKEDELLPKIHHAGLPREVVANSMNFKEGWVIGLEQLRENRLRNEVA